MTRILIAGCTLTALVGLLAWRLLPDPLPAEWTPEQRALIQSLSLSRLPATPGDPSNAVAESELAAELGHRLYFDQRLSGNGEVACANCHQPKNYFTDDRTLAVGTQTGFRHTPSLVGLAYSPWFYWDGRKDSQWAQALAPIEAGHEHNLDRLQVARLIVEDPLYKSQYEAIFQPLPALPAAPARPRRLATSCSKELGISRDRSAAGHQPGFCQHRQDTRGLPAQDQTGAQSF